METVSKTEHDFLTVLAEAGVAGRSVRETIREVCSVLGWKTEAAFRNTTYAVAPRLGVQNSGDFFELVCRVQKSAVSRGYQNEVYFFMDEGELDIRNRTPILEVQA